MASVLRKSKNLFDAISPLRSSGSRKGSQDANEKPEKSIKKSKEKKPDKGELSASSSAEVTPVSSNSNVSRSASSSLAIKKSDAILRTASGSIEPLSASPIPDVLAPSPPRADLSPPSLSSSLKAEREVEFAVPHSKSYESSSSPLDSEQYDGRQVLIEQQQMLIDQQAKELEQLRIYKEKYIELSTSVASSTVPQGDSTRSPSLPLLSLPSQRVQQKTAAEASPINSAREGSNDALPSAQRRARRPPSESNFGKGNFRDQIGPVSGSASPTERLSRGIARGASIDGALVVSENSDAEVVALRNQVRILQNLLQQEQVRHASSPAAVSSSAGGSPLQRRPSFAANLPRSLANSPSTDHLQGLTLAEKRSRAGSVVSDEGSPRLGAGSPSRLPLKQSSFKSSQKIFSSITSTASPSSSSSVGSNGSSAGGDQSAFFGVPLELLMARGGAVRYMEVPKLILNMTSYIIANLPKMGGDVWSAGLSATEQIRSDALRALLNSTPDHDFAAHGTDTKCVMAVLRTFLADLPTPLLSTDVQKQLRSVAPIEDEPLRLAHFHTMLHNRVPLFSRAVFTHLMSFLSNVAHHSPVTTLQLANIFAPLFFGAKEGTDFHPAAKSLRILLDDWPLLISTGDQSAVFSSEGLPLLKGATLVRCIDTMLDVHYTDEDFASMFLLLHPSLISNGELARILVGRYVSLSDLPISGNAASAATAATSLSNSTSGGDTKQWLQRLQVRIGSILAVWVAEFCPDVENEEVKAAFVDFLDRLPPMSVDTKNIYAFAHGQMAKRSSRKSSNADLFPPMPVSCKFSQLEPELVAEQLTLIDLELFVAIPLTEFFCKNLTSQERSPRFHEMAQRWNEWGRLIAGEILSYADIATRAEVLAKMIQIAYVCRKHNNFNTSYAIFCGLHFTPITRLKLTWDKLAKKFAHRFRKLDKLFGLQANYKQLRSEVKAAQEEGNSVIPYVGVYSKLIASVEEAVPSQIDNTGSGNVSGNPTNNVTLVNVEKMRSLWKMAEEIKKYQQTAAYHFTPNIPLQNLLRNARPMTEDQLFERSLLLEPKSTN